MNKNLWPDKILHLAWKQLLIYCNQIDWCVWGAAHTAISDFGVVQVIIIIVIARMQMDVGDMNKN